MLRAALPDKRIASAGVGALVGKSADINACDIAELHGISLAEHSAQQLTPSLCREYDLILVMEKEHIDIVCKIAPEVRGKVMLFGHWLNQKEIPDPYRKNREAFEFVYNLLDDAAQKWVKALSR